MQTMEIYPHKCIVVINLPWLGTLEHMERRGGPRSKAENVAQRNAPGYALLEDDPARMRVKYLVPCAWVGPGGCWEAWLALGLGLGGLGLHPGGQKPPFWAVRGGRKKPRCAFICGVGDGDA